ncbi:hypothetical protein BMS3Abin05_02522 [bacterium BMS3Abin05]|nr:hypothetical protein BMS3Abin05_02522 [bacterium BMS3Abin05]GBE27492.1 hypothetical protein BMS3Bbin03_01417 [bacterium BMS3Bbin03]
MQATGTALSRFAKQVSNVFIPPTWSVLMFWSVSIKLGHSLWQILVWGSIGTFFTAVLPILYVGWLEKRGKVTHKHIPLRSQRNGPYLLSLLLWLFTFLLLYITKAPDFLLAAVLASIGNTLFIFIVNLFWKISAHMLGTAGPLIILSFAFGWWAAPLYIFLLLIGWSRILLKAHTPAQAVWGGISGLVLTYVQMAFYLK